MAVCFTRAIASNGCIWCWTGWCICSVASRTEPNFVQRAGPGQVVAEGSIYAERFHCDAIAQSRLRVHAVGSALLRERLQSDYVLCEAWARQMALELRMARAQIEILSRKSVAERLDGWLGLHDGKLPGQGEWKSVAQQLAVSPEALYRELARRREGD